MVAQAAHTEVAEVDTLVAADIVLVVGSLVADHMLEGVDSHPGQVAG